MDYFRQEQVETIAEYQLDNEDEMDTTSNGITYVHDIMLIKLTLCFCV